MQDAILQDKNTRIHKRVPNKPFDLFFHSQYMSFCLLFISPNAPTYSTARVIFLDHPQRVLALPKFMFCWTCKFCLVCLFLLSKCFGCTLPTRQSSTQNDRYKISHRYSYFSWWWARSHLKCVEKRNKHTKKNVHQVGFIYKILTLCLLKLRSTEFIKIKIQYKQWIAVW